MGGMGWALTGVALSILALLGMGLGRAKGRKFYSNGGLALLLASMICIMLASYHIGYQSGSDRAQRDNRAEQNAARA